MGENSRLSEPTHVLSVRPDLSYKPARVTRCPCLHSLGNWGSLQKLPAVPSAELGRLLIPCEFRIFSPDRNLTILALIGIGVENIDERLSTVRRCLMSMTIQRAMRSL
jgi:hypothetical protein